MTDADGNDFYLSDPRTGRQFIFDYNHMSEFSRGRGTGLPQVPYNAVTKSYAYSPISNTLDATATAKLINAVGHREARKSRAQDDASGCTLPYPEAAIPAIPPPMRRRYSSNCSKYC